MYVMYIKGKEWSVERCRERKEYIAHVFKDSTITRTMESYSMCLVSINVIEEKSERKSLSNRDRIEENYSSEKHRNLIPTTHWPPNTGIDTGQFYHPKTTIIF